jgi:hypothetical protein
MNGIASDHCQGGGQVGLLNRHLCPTTTLQQKNWGGVLGDVVQTSYVGWFDLLIGDHASRYSVDRRSQTSRLEEVTFGETAHWCGQSRSGEPLSQVVRGLEQFGPVTFAAIGSCEVQAKASCSELELHVTADSAPALRTARCAHLDDGWAAL